MGYQHWAVTTYPEDILKIGHKLEKKLVYLSPDAELEVESIEKGKKRYTKTLHTYLEDLLIDLSSKMPVSAELENLELKQGNYLFLISWKEDYVWIWTMLSIWCANSLNVRIGKRLLILQLPSDGKDSKNNQNSLKRKRKEKILMKLKKNRLTPLNQNKTRTNRIATSLNKISQSRHNDPSSLQKLDLNSVYSK